MCVGGKRHAPVALILGTRCKGSWVGSRAGLDKTSPPPGYNPRTFQFAVQTKNLYIFFKYYFLYCIIYIFIFYILTS